MRILCNQIVVWHRRKQKHLRWILSCFTAMFANSWNVHNGHMVPAFKAQAINDKVASIQFTTSTGVRGSAALLAFKPKYDVVSWTKILKAPERDQNHHFRQNGRNEESWTQLGVAVCLWHWAERKLLRNMKWSFTRSVRQEKKKKKKKRL